MIMNKIKLFMSEEDYCRGFKFKYNKLCFSENSVPALMIVLGIAVAVLTAVLKLDIIAYAISAIFLSMALTAIISPTKKSISREYQMSPFTKRERTILFDDYRICFISPFEKIDLAVEDIFAYEINDGFVFIQPMVSCEFYLINKSKYQSSELDRLCSLLQSKCKKRNYGKNIQRVNNEPAVNEQSESEASIPFSFEMVIDSNDNLEIQKIAVRKNRLMHMCYIFAGTYLAFCLYEYLIDRDIKVLITMGVIAAAIAILAVFNNFVAVRLMANKIEKNDKFGAFKRNITVSSSFIETKVVSQEHGIETDKVIPYGYVNLAAENEKFFTIIAGSEKQIFIPKKYLTNAQTERLSEILKSKCRYVKMK